MDSPFRAKDEIWFLRMCLHNSNAVCTCLPDCPVALYQCLMACVSSNRVLDPEHISHYNALLCISICEVITYWLWCRIESHSLQCNMFIVYTSREVHFTCARPHCVHVLVCLLLEPDCHMSCRLLSVLSATSVQKYLSLLTDHCRLTWQKHIFTERKQLGLQLRRTYCIIGRKSMLSLENKLLIYLNYPKAHLDVRYPPLGYSK